MYPTGDFAIMQYIFGCKNPIDPKARAGVAGEYANNYTEYTVSQKAEGKYRTRRLLMILLYIAYALAYILIFITKIPMLVALLPVTLWILIFFTWRYVSVEHEYMIASGVMTFVDILGGRSRRVLFACTVKDMLEIAPITEASKANYADAKNVVDLRGSIKCAEGYYFTIKDDSGNKIAVLFAATAKAVKIMKYYNPAAIVSETLLK